MKQLQVKSYKRRLKSGRVIVVRAYVRNSKGSKTVAKSAGREFKSKSFMDENGIAEEGYVEQNGTPLTLKGTKIKDLDVRKIGKDVYMRRNVGRNTRFVKVKPNELKFIRDNYE